MSKIKKDVFGIGGLLHRDFGDGYEFRESQVNMSIACAKAILNGGILLAEGGTGVGKSFAYLIAAVSPSLRQALAERGSHAPIIISTSTKVLQDQLWQKDVPAILNATHQDLRAVLVKGRNNYISARRLQEFTEDVANQNIQFSTAEVAAIASRIAPIAVDWLETSDGEFASFGEPLPHEIRLEIESTDQDCQGKHCNFYSQCPFYRAKAKRATADILIVNHALLALHIAHRNVLPPECNVFIIDEAHKFFTAASGVFEIGITLNQVEWFLKTFRKRLSKLRDVVEDADQMDGVVTLLNTFASQQSRDTTLATAFFQDAHHAVQDAAGSTSRTETSSRFGYAVLTPELDATEMLSMLSAYSQTLSEKFDVSLNDEAEESKFYLRLGVLYRSAIEIRSRLKAIVSQEEPHLWCYWSEVAIAASDMEQDKDSPYRLTLKRTPIDISEQIQPLFAEENAVIFTSATLQVAGSFARIQSQLGLNGKPKADPDDTQDPDSSETPLKPVTQRVYPSPFPYQENVEIHLFSTLLDRPSPYAPDAEKEAYYQEQQRLVEYYLRLHDGRALVLCASQQQLHELYQRLEPVFSDMGITALRQYGTEKLRQTLQTFKADETSVLFGVASCWEGLDASGPTLQTVIIPQLPFAPPHPVLDARRELLENPEEDWFREISLPDMLLQVKQGAGRLIRCTTDTGVIAILSPRPLTKNYGRDILKALPPGKIIRNPVEALDCLETQNEGPHGGRSSKRSRSAIGT